MQHSSINLEDKLSPATSRSLETEKKMHKEVVAKNGPEK